MAVEYITYGDQKLPIKIGYFALKMMQKEHGMTLESAESELEAYEPLLYYALMQGHKVMKKEFPFEMSDMVDILDDCFFEFTEKLTAFFPPELLEKMMAGEGLAKTKKKGK